MRTSESHDCAGPYERGPLREVTGPTMRPGGLGLTERALKFCRFPAKARLLDVGCGTGATVEHLGGRGFNAQGVDISRVLLAEGVRRNPALALTEASAEGLPFGSQTQDGVFCECVLSLLEDQQSAVAEFRRVLVSGGRLILSDIYSRVGAAAGGQDGCRGEPTRREVLRLLFEAGFATLLWEDHTPLLRELAARLMLAHGSLGAFGCATGVAGERPGYYLLVARKA